MRPADTDLPPVLRRHGADAPGHLRGPVRARTVGSAGPPGRGHVRGRRGRHRRADPRAGPGSAARVRLLLRRAARPGAGPGAPGTAAVAGASRTVRPGAVFVEG